MGVWRALSRRCGISVTLLVDARDGIALSHTILVIRRIVRLCGSWAGARGDWYKTRLVPIDLVRSGLLRVLVGLVLSFFVGMCTLTWS